MKRCPECRRDYYDETLLYCLDDGSPLLEGAGTSEEATAVLPSSELGYEPSTAPLHESTLRPGTHTTLPSTTDSGPSGIKRHRTKVAVAALAVMLGVGGISFAVYKFGWPGKSAPQSVPFQSMKIERLTSNGKATDAVISPDGRQVVYVLDDGGKRSLWLRQMATMTDLQLREADSKVVYRSLTISRDGDFLYYVDDGTSLRNRILYQMPLVGGSPKKIVDDIGTPIGLSPDGKKMAYVRSREKESVMIIANADGTGEREIAKRPGNRSFGSLFAGGIAWSKDAKKIISVSDTRDSEGRFHSLVEITIEDGSERMITPHRWHQIDRLVILADGSGLVFTAAEKASENRSKQVWYLPYPGGDARKITNDLNHYTDLSLNADSSALVTVQENIDTDIWVAPDGDAERATQLSSVSGKLDGWDSVAWTPDGKIVYTSVAGGGNDGIWMMDGDGRNRKRLTPVETVAYWPAVTADGRFIFYNVEVKRIRHIWRMNIDGSYQKEMFAGSGAKTAAGFVYYGGAQGIWRVPIDGGDAVRISEGGLDRCSISPDAKLFACQFDPPDDAPEATIRVISAEAGVPVKDFDIRLDLPGRIRWTPDGRSITYVSRVDGLNDIWSQPVDGGQPKRITNFKTDQIFSFDWSRDNKLVLSHGSEASDVVLIRNIKQ